MLHQAYTDRCFCDRSILQWHTAFVRKRLQSVELIPHGGRPATVHIEVNVKIVAVAIREERHSTPQLAKLLNIYRTSVNQILTENLAVRRVSSVWVPHILTNTQMNNNL